MRAYDLSNARWRKSSFSDGNGGDCLEVADDITGVIPVRDSKAAPDGDVLLVSPAAWAAFVAGVRRAGPGV